MIEITEVVETYTWATIPCQGQEGSVHAAITSDGSITFHRARRLRIGNDSRSLWHIEDGALTVKVRAFVVAVQRLWRGVESISWANEGRFVRAGDRVVFTTTCGEVRTFRLDNLVALAEWAQEPNPS